MELSLPGAKVRGNESSSYLLWCGIYSLRCAACAFIVRFKIQHLNSAPTTDLPGRMHVSELFNYLLRECSVGMTDVIYRIDVMALFALVF